MELTIENLIKIIIGVLVFVVVVLGIYFFFKEDLIDFFNNLVPDKPKDAPELILSLLK
ncbi:hypothetical protein J4422_03435 [Candidatus Pacearchaeota archaeon]|nr:hypothetical protein [Candidatus Pacearchaeota archaeon]